jgi:hypothetical protein
MLLMLYLKAALAHDIQTATLRNRSASLLKLLSAQTLQHSATPSRYVLRLKLVGRPNIIHRPASIAYECHTAGASLTHEAILAILADRGSSKAGGAVRRRPRHSAAHTRSSAVVERFARRRRAVLALVVAVS